MNSFIVNKDIPYDGSKFRVELNIVIYNNVKPINTYPTFLKGYENSGGTKFWLLCPEGCDLSKEDAEKLAKEYEEKWHTTVVECEETKDWSKMEFLKDWECIYHK